MNAMRFVGAVVLVGFVEVGVGVAQSGSGDGAATLGIEEDAQKAVEALDWGTCAKTYEARAPKENDAANRRIWSECLTRLKRWDDAIKALQPLAERDETKDAALVRIGLIELQREKVDDASPYFSRVIAKNANDAVAQYGFGEVHYRRYRQGVQVSRLKAQEAFRAYLEHSANARDEARRDEVRKKMLILDFEKQGEEAVAAEDLVLKGTPESLAEAKTKLDAVVAANADIEWAQFWLGEVTYAPAAGKEGGALFDSSDDKALAAYKKAPKLARALLRVGEIEARRGRWKEAEEAFAEAALLDKRMQAALNWLGRINAQKGDAEKAKSYWKDAMAVDIANEYGREAALLFQGAGTVDVPREATVAIVAPVPQCVDEDSRKELRVAGMAIARAGGNAYDVVTAIERAVAKRGERVLGLRSAQARACLQAYKQEIVAIRRGVHDSRLALERFEEKKYDAAVKELEALLPFVAGDAVVRRKAAMARSLSAIEKWGGAEWRIDGFPRFKAAGDTALKPDDAALAAARIAIATELQRDRGFAKGWTFAGLLAWIAVDNVGARVAFAKAAELQAKSATALNNLTVVKLQGADLKLIEPPPTTKKRAKKRAPELPPVAKDAIAALTAAAKLDRRYADVHFNLGRLYGLLGDARKAAAAYKVYLKLGAQDDESWRGQATSAIDAAKKPAARKATRKKKGGA
ncbi:MAG: hypothetical protein HYY84_13775 [Deltaproteobacteria bacterium]|nr:hypothetical protein [Deltaproteobacteria bacterium]